MFRFEAALATAEAAAGVIPDDAAVTIGRVAAAPGALDLDVLRAGLRASATLSIPVVHLLTGRVRAVVLACAQRLPGLVATMFAAMTHEHERTVGGWQAEGATLVDATGSVAAAVAALAG